MIYTFTGSEDPYVSKIKDDPVRPHLSDEFRFGKNCTVFALQETDKIKSIVCTKLCSRVPSNEAELLDDNSDNPSVIVFYTIWSYSPGAGRDLILEALQKIKLERPEIKRFVTLSPQTEMARKFHLKNGAEIFRINSGSVNYEYY